MSFRPKGWIDHRILAEIEIPADPTLPQLSTVLDAGIMGRLLQGKLPGGFVEGRFQIERCRIVFVRYKPPRYCHVFYALDISDSVSGRRGTQIMGAKVFVRRLSKSYVARHTEWIKGVPDYGLSFAYVPDYNMILTAFPNDLRLHGLHQLVYADELESVVRTTLELPTARVGVSADNGRPVQVVSYRPERYCLVRCIVQPSNSASETGQRRLIFARMCHTEETGDQAHRVMVALWNGMARRSRLLWVAKPLGYDPTSRILFQSAVAGTTLTSLIGHKDFLRYVEAAARSLATIHQTPAHMEQSTTPEDELQEMEPMAETMTQVLPAVGEKLNKVLDRLRSNLPDSQGQARDFIHGDFSTNQILVDGNRLSVIDFNSVCMGDPHRDLGSFLARLEHHLQGPLMQRAAEAFCRQYEAGRPGVLNRERLIWEQARGFVRDAFIALKKVRSGWPRRVDHYLSQAETLLGEQARARP